MGRRAYYGGLAVRELWSRRFLPPCLTSHWMRALPLVLVVKANLEDFQLGKASFSLACFSEYCASSFFMPAVRHVLMLCDDSLYGFSVHQAYRYIRSFPTDAVYIRLLVSVFLFSVLMSGR